MLVCKFLLLLLIIKNSLFRVLLFVWGFKWFLFLICWRIIFKYCVIFCLRILEVDDVLKVNIGEIGSGGLDNEIEVGRGYIIDVLEFEGKWRKIVKIM